MGKVGLCRRSGRGARSLAIVAAITMIGLCLAGAAQAQPGRVVGHGALGLRANVRAQSAATPDEQCFYTTPSCSSSDPRVAFSIVSVGDTTGCTSQNTVNWGDKSSTSKTYPGVADGKTLVSFDHV